MNFVRCWERNPFVEGLDNGDFGEDDGVARNGDEDSVGQDGFLLKYLFLLLFQSGN